MQHEILYGIDGRVLNSNHSVHVVRVEDDRRKSGGFFVYERWVGSTGPNSDGEYDSWVQDEASLKQFFAESGWSMNWDGN